MPPSDPETDARHSFISWPAAQSDAPTSPHQQHPSATAGVSPLRPSRPTSATAGASAQRPSRPASATADAPVLRPSRPASATLDAPASPPMRPLQDTSAAPSAQPSTIVPSASSVAHTPHPMTTRARAGIVKPNPKYQVNLAHSALISSITHSVVPRGFKSAAKSPIWLAAMQEEINALRENDTWDLVPCPDNANLVSCKWVFRTKFKSDGSIDRHKARLVAQGFSQIYGSDFHHTFSPVVKSNTVRVILALATTRGWSLHQLDIKNAFLNGSLDKPVYMDQPPGFVDPRFPSHVCRLKKALYGLRQAPLAWFHRFSSYLFALGFQQSRADTSLFFFFKDRVAMYLLLYVDDIIITGNDPTTLRNFIARTNKEFKLTDLGKLSYFLGLEVTYTAHGLFLGQAKYASDILNRVDLLDAKPVATPLAPGVVLVRDGDPFPDSTLYRSLVGALQYLTITRPDLSYAVNQVNFYKHPLMSTFKRSSAFFVT